MNRRVESGFIKYDPRFTTKALKHGGSSIKVCRCFSYRGVDPIRKFADILYRYAYVDIIQNIMIPFSEKDMPLKWILQQDNDAKHTSTIAKEWFRVNGIKVMDWHAQSH